MQTCVDIVSWIMICNLFLNWCFWLSLQHGCASCIVCNEVASMSNLKDVAVVHNGQFFFWGFCQNPVVQDEQNVTVVGSWCLDYVQHFWQTTNLRISPLFNSNSCVVSWFFFFKICTGSNCSILWSANGAAFVEVITSIDAVKSTSRHRLSWSELVLVYVSVPILLRFHEMITSSSWTGKPEFARMTTQNILSTCAT